MVQASVVAKPDFLISQRFLTENNELPEFLTNLAENQYL
jgi:hypothetical protein